MISPELNRSLFAPCLALAVGFLLLASPVMGTGALSATSRLPQAVAKNIRRQLAARMQMGEELFEVRIDNLQVRPQLNEFIGEEVQVLGLGSSGSSRLDGLFSLTLQAETAEGPRELQASGVLTVVGPAFVARGNLNSGQVLTAQDLVQTRMAWRQLPTGAAGFPAANWVGRRVRQWVASGDPLSQMLVDEPFAVNNGDAVELTLRAGPGVMVRSRGIAKQAGRMGDSISVVQPDTNKKIMAIVNGTKSVEVQL